MPSKPYSKTKRNYKPTNIRTFRNKRTNEAKRASQSKRLQEINKLRQIHETKQVQRLKVKIIAVIWGHGSLTQTPFENQYNERIKLNIFGFGVSGVCAWLDRSLSNYVNEGLSYGKRLDDKLLTKLNNFNVAKDAVFKFAEDSKSAITSLGTTHSIYATVKDFGRRGKKLRSDKTFTGENNPENAGHMYPDDMIPKLVQGPVLRIYSIMITNELGEIIVQQISPVDIILPNYSRLANIQVEINNFVHNMTIQPTSKFEIPADTLHDIELDLFDTTCNYTEKEPVIAYLENKTIRKHASRGKIRKFRPDPNRVKHPIPTPYAWHTYRKLLLHKPQI